MSTAAPPAPATLDVGEFVARHAGDHVELVRGHVVELPMASTKHGKVCFLLALALGRWAEADDLGHIMTNDSFVRTGPDTVRGPDVCFFSYGRLPRGPVPEGLLPVAPDLAFEIRSHSDSWTEVFEKIAEYLDAGVRVVVVLDAESVTASVYRPGGLQHTIAADADLTVPEVLPGFAARVDRLFE